MKDYLKEREELINPMKSLMDSIKPINTYDISRMDEMEYILYPMKKIYGEMNSMKGVMDSINSYSNIYPTPTFLSPFEELKKKMEYDLNPLKKLQDEMEYLFNPFKRIQDEINFNFNSISQLNFLEKSINPMKSAIESLKLASNSTPRIDELNELLKSLNLSSLTIEETIQNKLEEQIDLLTKEDRKTLDEVIDSLKYMFPDISYLFEKFSKGKYIPIIIYIFLSIPTIYSFYTEYFKQNIVSDSYYKINRNKVRVRTEPSTNGDSIIIIKLNKNVFVERIGSHKNWLKIEFEDDNGEEKQGWVRQDMLTKIKN